MRTCSACGNFCPPDDLFCLRCQAPLPVDAPAVEPAAASGPSSSFSAIVDDPEQPQEIDFVGKLVQSRYRVDAKLGQGGMGTVFSATDTRLSRQVALKVLAPELVAHPTARKRMAQEANALARIEHPNVVRVLDVFDEGALMVLVLELITGGDLAGRIRTGALNLPDAVAMLDGMLQGLEAIHAAKLVHRDIKPDNVLISITKVPKLTDLGVARDEAAVQRTQLGARLGTPEYMSPEQAQALPVDARSDLYSMTLVFYEMLTARLPFIGTTELDILAARVQREPDLSALPAAASHYLPFLLKGLHRDVQQRFSSAAEMRSALANPAVLAATPGPATAPVSLAKAPAAAQPAPAAPAIAAVSAPVAPRVAPAPANSPAKSSPPWAVIAAGGFALLGAVAWAATRDGQAPPPAAGAAVTAAAPEAPVAAVAPAALAAPAAPPPEPDFVATSEACAWTTSAQSAWLERGRKVSFSLRAAVKSPYYGLEANRPTVASGKANEIIFTGKNGNQRVSVPGFEVLTVKTFAPSLNVEWVTAFWATNQLSTTDGPAEGRQEVFMGQSAVTITRITADSFETRIIRFDNDTATDENDGHFMHIRYDPGRSATECVLRLATNNGEFNKRGKPADPKRSRWMTLPNTPEAGWPTDLGGEWGSQGGFLNPL